MTLRYATFSTPVGNFSVAIDESDSVVASAFGDVTVLRSRFSAETLKQDPASLAFVRRQVADYFAGTRREFSLKFALLGTAFQKKIWAALQAIPYGQTTSYAQLASQSGVGANSARAVGAANGANPICLFIPCHRVIGSDGSLTGYAFGTDIKRALLDLEGAARKAA